ncbi:MAG: hypothetical protein AB1442_12380 [Nitrospirota bacterium]
MKEEKIPYDQPKILASYQKEELEAIIRPHGDDCTGGACGTPEQSGGGCGCGCGGAIP